MGAGSRLGAALLGMKSKSYAMFPPRAKVTWGNETLWAGSPRPPEPRPMRLCPRSGSSRKQASTCPVSDPGNSKMSSSFGSSSPHLLELQLAYVRRSLSIPTSLQTVEEVSFSSGIFLAAIDKPKCGLPVDASTILCSISLDS